MRMRDGALAQVTRPRYLAAGQFPETESLIRQMLRDLNAKIDTGIRVRMEELGATMDMRVCSLCGQKRPGWYGPDPGQHIVIVYPTEALSTTIEDPYTLSAKMDLSLTTCRAVYGRR